MFGLGKKKVDKKTWAALVLGQSVSNPDALTVEKLSAATDHLLPQLCSIVLESVQIIERTKNPDTRQGRIDLCRRHLERMDKIKPFANVTQLAIIHEAERAFSSVRF